MVTPPFRSHRLKAIFIYSAFRRISFILDKNLIINFLKLETMPVSTKLYFPSVAEVGELFYFFYTKMGWGTTKKKIQKFRKHKFTEQIQVKPCHGKAWLL